MVGITKPIILEADYFGPVKSPFSGRSCIGFCASGKVNREDHGMKSDQPMEGGGLVIAREVEIALDIEADLLEE